MTMREVWTAVIASSASNRGPARWENLAQHPLRFHQAYRSDGISAYHSSMVGVFEFK